MSNIKIKDNGKIKLMLFNKMMEFEDKVKLGVSLKTYDNNFKVYQNGASIYKEYYDVKKKYQLMADAMDINVSDILIPRQMHTDNILEILGLEDEITEPVDGFITNIPNIPIATTFADCIPLFFYDPVKNVIANIHSGWKGTVKKIGPKAIGILNKNYGSKPENIICLIGPCIRKDHFLVNEDVKEIFEFTFKDLCKKAKIIIETDKSNEIGKQYAVDTILINKLIFAEMGLLEENIIDSEICTVCESDKFHSFRVEGKNYELNTGIMMLK